MLCKYSILVIDMNDDILIKTKLTGRSFSTQFRFKRAIWMIFYFLLFKFSPKPFFRYRNFILRAFGAKISGTARVNQSAKIWYPENLVLGNNSAIGFDVVIYNQGMVTIGDNCIISQYSYICASTHDYTNPLHPLVLAPIEIGSNVWVCAGSFVGPGVNVADGAVIGARAVLTKDALPWSVYAGNPARKIKDRSFEN
jgi:putative colanic acid biosynthesis acetyltransferase WcaF